MEAFSLIRLLCICLVLNYAVNSKYVLIKTQEDLNDSKDLNEDVDVNDLVGLGDKAIFAREMINTPLGNKY